MNIQNKVAVVTGGTHGIGAATALALARQGAAIAIIARNIKWSIPLERTEATEPAPRVAPAKADLLSASPAVAAISAELPHLVGIRK